MKSILESGQILVKAIEKRRPISPFKLFRALKLSEAAGGLCELLGEASILLEDKSINYQFQLAFNPAMAEAENVPTPVPGESTLSLISLVIDI